MIELITIVVTCLILGMLYSCWRENKESLKRLEDFERTLDPNFDNHRKEWDHINNNYTVFINRI